MNKQEKLIKALKNASEDKLVKVRCINADNSDGDLIKNEIYDVCAKHNLYNKVVLLESVCKGMWNSDRFELFKRKRK